jgi:hypothetical protein
MAFDACEVSGATSTLTWVPGLAPTRLSVTPGIAPVTVLDALETEMPFTVSEALLPVFPLEQPEAESGSRKSR